LAENFTSKPVEQPFVKTEKVPSIFTKSCNYEKGNECELVVFI